LSFAFIPTYSLIRK